MDITDQCKLGVLVAALLTTSACASVHKTGDSTPTTVSQQAQKVAVQQDATYVTEITFDKNSSKLTPSDAKKLDSIVSHAKETGKIDDIKVISWADYGYPSMEKKRLSKAQRTLAEKRSMGIKKYLKSDDQSLDVDTYSMAERPGKIAELFNTDNVRVKRALESASIKDDQSAYDHPGNAGKSMVLVILKNE